MKLCSDPVDVSAIATLTFDVPLSRVIVNVSAPSNALSAVTAIVFVFDAGVRLLVRVSLVISALVTPEIVYGIGVFVTVMLFASVITKLVPSDTDALSDDNA